MKASAIPLRTTIPFAVLSCLALWLSACGRTKNPESPSPIGDSMLIEPRVRVGKIRAGMTPDQIEQVLGRPKDKTLEGTLFYPELGFLVSFRGGVVSVVNCETPAAMLFPDAKEFKGRTKEGVGMGSTRDELIKAFGQPSKVVNYRGSEFLDYHERWLTFVLTDGKVQRIRIALQAMP